ncbi:MAG: hypothetical protein K9K67_15605 [Bacteriovoracaceae bacterium]|nr:hypothetical protein [Bacteriovoracaceae bacterium]
MNFLISLLLTLFITSCGFVSSDDEQGLQQIREVDPLVKGLSPNEDFDGDLIANKVEQDQGSSPLIANIPNIRMRFLQNYQIKIDYKNLADGSEKSFNINTNTHQDNPDFKYRVGEVFIRNESFSTAASVGKFSSHSWGELKEHDLSWVNYPEVDPRFYSEKVLKYKPYFNQEDFEITNITISLENNIKLKANDGFSEIKNLSLNFYYYDYEKESFQLLTTKLVERNFQAGINETFEVTIENVPSKLVATNYFQKGEFIISELADYEIPSMKTTYKKLLASVRKKSIPVIYNTPLSSEINYVGTDGKSSSFSEIVSRLYGNKAIIEQNKLKKINQFETNLPEFTYLSEVREHDKKGKWFVFTNKLKKHYLDHDYTSKDIVSLSYITGKELASQNEEKVFSYRPNALSTDSRGLYPLGNITPNSRIHLQFKALGMGGTRVSTQSEIVRPSGNCSGNCYRAEFACHVSVNKFESFLEDFAFEDDLSFVGHRVKLVINQEEFYLKDLVEEKKVNLHWVGNNIHLDIKDITQIHALNNADEYSVAVKLLKKRVKTFDGVYLSNAEGRDANVCIRQSLQLAHSMNLPMSVRSWKFGEWQSQVDWSKIKKGQDRNYTEEFWVDMTSVITNFYN